MRLAVAVPREKEWFVSWPEEGDERACSSPAPVRPCTGWKCRDVTHGHDDELKADIIALASCKDSELSWEDPSGKSMTQELVRILERDRHPTLRSLITRLSHALHSMSLERHFQARRYKRGLENYNVFLERQRANAALHRPRGAATEDTASHISTLLPSIPDATVPVSRQSLFFSDPKDRDGTAVAMQKPRPLPAARFRSAGFVDERTFDVENFQDPQISSHYPLNMEQPWCL
ncbi:hypothetical protein C8R45DRAFT_259493 [Mycena sanguinolenta]|nr:hypothetical protein C8R45DRAFT_259493 [Mycena sanguinolenta]